MNICQQIQSGQVASPVLRELSKGKQRTLLSIVRNISPAVAVLPQLAAILLYTACRLSLDSEASTPPVVPSFLAPYLCAAISCGDVSNLVEATQLETIR